MRARNRRLIVIGVAAVMLSAALGLAALGLRDSVAFFQTPSEFAETPPEPGRSVRVGGLVELGSITADGDALLFTLSDDVSSVRVRYIGVLPNLFREGQCVIAIGVPDSTRTALEASRLIAKHDENYRAPEIEAAPRLAESCGPEAMNAGGSA